MDEQEFLGMLYRLDVHGRYARLCRLLATDPTKVTIERLQVEPIVQRHFPGAKPHAKGLIWTYRRFIDRYQFVIVLWLPSRVMQQGATATFMLIIRWEDRQVSSVAMRNIYHHMQMVEHQRRLLYAQLYNEDDLNELVLFSRVLYDDVYASMVRVAG